MSRGLFTDSEDPRFATSPDVLIELDGLIEVKNP